MRFTKICVLGLGYIGLPTASTFAAHGIKVIGVDVNPDVINELRNGRLHIYEPGLQKIFQSVLKSKSLIISEKPEMADAFIISVPTPFYNDKTADMRSVSAATESIVPFLRKGNLVVLESTSPPLTTANLVVPILEKTGLHAGKDFLVAYSPERVLPGKILQELIENARVIGGINAESANAGRDLYAVFVKGEIILTTATTAEMVKLMENTYRDVNIAVANEFSRLAERFGINVWEAIRIANLHPRVKILDPGPGVGGHCISVDPWFLVEAAPDITPLILASRQVNDGQPHFVVSRAKQLLKNKWEGKHITCLGLSYKPDVDDLRESPAVEVAELLTHTGCKVNAFEPFKPNAKFATFDTSSSLDKSLEKSQLIILLVAHSSFKSLKPETLAKLTKCRVILDTVHALDQKKYEKAGFTVHTLGDQSPRKEKK